jgi:ABC-type methionine transport system permease subunit
MTEPEHDETPPVGEEIHLPGPSLLPLLVAIGLTCMVVGTTIGWWLSILGLILFVATTVTWIRDTRRDIDDLPEDHGH